MRATSQSGQALASSTAEEALLSELGRRTRRARTLRGMTRRALASRSGVSERYLAQLEQGTGNASVLVLGRIATALGIRVTELLEDPPLDLPEPLPAPARNQRIALLGLRGAGKSTLGKRLAAHRKVAFLELDREIERRAGIPLEELFLLYGQATYRRHEERCLARILAEHPACVIATGGSIVASPAVYATLLATCRSVWLRAAPAEHMARVIAQGDLRPMAGNSEAMQDLTRILEERAPLYSRAEQVLDTSGLSVEESFQRLLATLAQA